MNKKQYCLLVILVIVSGVIGGGLSNWMLMGEFAFARKLVSYGISPNKQIITAQELRLIDIDGNEQITIGPNSTGDPRIVFWNTKTHSSSIILGLNKEKEPGLVFWDNNGKSRATLLLNDNGNPKLRFIGDDGKANCITLGISSDGEPGLALFDHSGAKRSELTVSSDEAALGFLDNKGVKRFGFGMLTENNDMLKESPMLYLRENDEQAYWKWIAAR